MEFLSPATRARKSIGIGSLGFASLTPGFMLSPASQAR